MMHPWAIVIIAGIVFICLDVLIQIFRGGRR
jgi:hypothetical protein